MKKRLPIIVIALVIVAGLFAVRMKRVQQKNNSPLLKSVPMTVQTDKVARQTIASGRHVLGEVIGADEAEIAPRIMAQIIEVEVREGQTVTKGQLLAVLDKREQQDGFDAASAAMDAAQIGADTQRDATARDKVLYDAKAISQEQWDRSRSLAAAMNAKLAAAINGLKQAKTRLSYTRLTSPVDGIVAERLVDPGDLAVPGKPALKIVRQTNVRVRGKLSQEDMGLLGIGQPVALTANDVTINAAVSRIFPATDRNHLAVFEVDLNNPPASLVAGMTVGMDISFASAEGLSIPVTSLLEGENGNWVFTVRDQKIHPVKVQILSAGSDAVAVSGDLNVGDQVVTARPSRLMMLSEGQTVQLAQQGGGQ